MISGDADVRVRIDRFLDGVGTAYFIFTHRQGQLYVFSLEKQIFDFVAKEGDYIPTGSVKPTFTLPWHVSEGFNRAIVEELTKNFGVATDTEAGLKGKVAAMADHLSDMRKLVFESPKVLSVAVSPDVKKT